MGKAGYFSGEGGYDRLQVDRVAQRVCNHERELKYDYIWSAARFLIQSGNRDPRDRDVLAEARKRRDMQVRATEKMMERLGA